MSQAATELPPMTRGGRNPLVSESDLEDFATLPREGFFSSERSFYWKAVTPEGRGLLHTLVSAESYGKLSNPDDIFSRISFAITMGADPDSRECEGGETPLHWAIWNTSPICVKALVSSGANPFVTNDAGITPLALLRDIRGIVRRRHFLEIKNLDIENILVSHQYLCKYYTK